MKLDELSHVCTHKETQLYNLDCGNVFICLGKLYVLNNKKSMNGYRVIDLADGSIHSANRESMVLPLVKFNYEMGGVKNE